MKFSEIQMTLLKIQIFGFEFGRNLYIKVLFWYLNSDSVLYIQIFSHIHSDFVSDQSGRCGSHPLSIKAIGYVYKCQKPGDVASHKSITRLSNLIPPLPRPSMLS